MGKDSDKTCFVRWFCSLNTSKTQANHNRFISFTCNFSITNGVLIIIQFYHSIVHATFWVWISWAYWEQTISSNNHFIDKLEHFIHPGILKQWHRHSTIFTTTVLVTGNIQYNLRHSPYFDIVLHLQEISIHITHIFYAWPFRRFPLTSF